MQEQLRHCTEKLKEHEGYESAMKSVKSWLVTAHKQLAACGEVDEDCSFEEIEHRCFCLFKHCLNRN